MKLTLIALLLLAPALHAQMDQCNTAMTCGAMPVEMTPAPVKKTSTFDSQRILVGVASGESFNNAFLGPRLAAEVPLWRRFELDASFEIAPESKRGYGTGWETKAEIGGIAWITTKLGATSGVEFGNYSVTQASKTAMYLSSGPILRVSIFGSPSRLTFGYVRQLRNGISQNGTETNHLSGGFAALDSRVGCTGAACWRVKEEFQLGHVLNQGNPLCDGTYGDGSRVGFAPCPRSSSLGGGFTVGVALEFPRRRGRENDPF